MQRKDKKISLWKTKRALSYSNEAEIEIESIAQGKDFYLKITRAKFEDLCKDLFNLCKEPINEVLEKSGEDRTNIDEIVLVGGSTRIPKIQSILKEYFDGKYAWFFKKTGCISVDRSIHDEVAALRGNSPFPPVGCLQD